MSQGLRNPSFVHQYRSEFHKNFANSGVFYCDGCLLRNFTGPMFLCESCNNFVVCQACISEIHRVHDPSHKFSLKVKKEELEHENNGITCRGCSTNNFTGPRFNCQQCLDSYDLCQQCISRASSLHVRGHTFVVMSTPDNKSVHETTTCDGCKTKPIIGLRYKCQSCSDYDLCRQCHMENIDGKLHDVTHQFQAIDKTKSDYDFEKSVNQRAADAIARIRAKYGPEYNGDAIDPETGWSIADARIQEQQAFQLSMMRTQMYMNQAQNMFNVFNRSRW